MTGPLLRRLSVALAAGGLLVSAYLTYVHFDERALVCGVGDCATVQASAYATIAGVPVALLGLAAYAALGVLAGVRLRRPGWAAPATLLLWAGSLAGVIYSAYLTYVEVWVLDAICQWCVVSAVLMTVLFVVETVQVMRVDAGD